MATALGVFSSIASLAELSCKCIRYIKKFRDAPQDVVTIERELAVLNGYLSRLQSLMKLSSGRKNVAWASSIHQFNNPGSPLCRLIVLLTNLSTIIRQPKSKIQLLKRRAMWPIVGRDAVKELLHCIRRTIVLLIAAVQMDAVKLDITIKQDLEAIRDEVDVISADTAFLTTFLVKAIAPSDEFGIIARAPGDIELEIVEKISDWVTHELNPQSSKAFAEMVVDISLADEKLYEMLFQASFFQLPKDLNSATGFEMVKLVRGDRNSYDKALIMKVLPSLCKGQLHARGISIAWKALYDTSTRHAKKRNGPLFAMLLTQEIKYYTNFPATLEVDVFARAKNTLAPAKHTTTHPSSLSNIGLTTGELIHISILFENGALWSDTHGGYVSPHVVDIINPTADICAWLERYCLPSDFHARVPHTSFDPSAASCPGGIAHLIVPANTAHKCWWGEQDGNWQYFHHGKFYRLDYNLEVNNLVRARHDWSRNCLCNACLHYSRDDVIRITKDCSDGWWWGEMGDMSGWVSSDDFEKLNQEDVFDIEEEYFKYN